MAILPYSYKPLFSNSGSSSWQSGHPLHFGLTALLFLSTCYLYMTSVPAVTFTPTTQLDLPLSKRLERSEAAYQRSINARPYLYKMYGNDPLSYPSEPPYPPYTVWDFVGRSIYLRFSAERMSDDGLIQLYPAFSCPFEVERIGVPVSHFQLWLGCETDAKFPRGTEASLSVDHRYYRFKTSSSCTALVGSLIFRQRQHS